MHLLISALSGSEEKKSGILSFFEPRKIQLQVTISLTFYEQLFCINVFCGAFLYLQFVCVYFWQKNIGGKATHKMLMKLTTGSNFIEILRVAFLYSQFVFVLFGTCCLSKKASYKILMKFTTGCLTFATVGGQGGDHRAADAQR